MPGLVRRLPVIATVLRPRVVPDAAMTWHLTHDRIDGRFELGAADVAFALGHEPTARYLAGEFAALPALREGFARARTVTLPPLRGDDLYGARFEAVRSLARRPQGVLPPFMQGDAWDDLRMNSLVVGFGQLRHANELAAASSYDGAAARSPTPTSTRRRTSTTRSSTTWAGRAGRSRARGRGSPLHGSPWRRSRRANPAATPPRLPPARRPARPPR